MIAAAVVIGLFTLTQTPGDASRSRVEHLLSLDSVREAAALADSIMTARDGSSGTLAPMAALFGRLDAAAGELGQMDPTPGTTSALLHLASGSVPDAIGSLEARLLGDAGDDGRLRANRGSALRALTHLGFRLRGTGPSLVATAQDAMTLLLVHEAARDSAGVRDMLLRADAAARGLALRNQAPPLALAEAEVWLGDSAAALARLLAFERRWTAMDASVMWGMVGNGWTLGRTWMLLGRLAAAQGRGEDAARAFRRVAELWADADPALQALLGNAAATPARSGERVLLRPSLSGEERYRFDAVAWMRTPFQLQEDTAMLVAKITLVARERASTGATGTMRQQRFDSVALELPVFANAGDAGITLLRAARAGMRGLVTETMTDSLGRLLGREVRSEAGVPGELRRVLESQSGFGPLGAAIVFPAAAVSVGDSWTDSVGIYLPGGVLDEDTRVLVRYTLIRLERIEGRRTAFIAMSGATGARTAADGTRSEAAITGELVWDVDAGAAVRLAASMRASSVNRLGIATPARVLMTALRQPAAVSVMAARD